MGAIQYLLIAVLSLAAPAFAEQSPESEVIEELPQYAPALPAKKPTNRIGNRRDLRSPSRDVIGGRPQRFTGRTGVAKNIGTQRGIARPSKPRFITYGGLAKDPILGISSGNYLNAPAQGRTSPTKTQSVKIREIIEEEE